MNFDGAGEQSYINQQYDQPQDGFEQQHAQEEQNYDGIAHLQHGENANIIGEIVGEDGDEEHEEVIPKDSFYLRLYSGHQAKDFGHEFLEFELREDRLLRYANDSQYKRDIQIRKQVKLSPSFFDWIRSRVAESNIIQADDSTWPEENQVGRQELELKLNGEHVFFVTCKFGSKAELLKHNADPSLECFYNLANDLKLWFLDIIGLHFRLSEL